MWLQWLPVAILAESRTLRYSKRLQIVEELQRDCNRCRDRGAGRLTESCPKKGAHMLVEAR